MTTLILITAGQTQWHTQHRMLGDTDLPLSDLGKTQTLAISRDLMNRPPDVLRSGPEQSTKESATLIAHALKLRLRTIKDFREMDLGIWEGLTSEEFEERFTKVHRQWQADATSIEPPEGESILETARRLEKGLRSILKKHRDERIALVLGPYAAAILRARLADKNFDSFWEYVNAPPSHFTVDIPESEIQ